MHFCLVSNNKRTFYTISLLQKTFYVLTGNNHNFNTVHRWFFDLCVKENECNEREKIDEWYRIHGRSVL
jgi:hypothetical protein